MRQYKVEQSDQGLRVLSHDGSTVWSQLRQLDDSEISTTVFDSHKRPRWIIRQPVKGWFLVLDPVVPLANIEQISLEPIIHASLKGCLAFFVPSKDSRDGRCFHLLPVQPALSVWHPRTLWNKLVGTDLTLSFVCRDTVTNQDFLAFADHSSVGLSGETRGELVLDQNLVDESGLDPSFFVAVAFAFLAYTTDREAYEMQPTIATPYKPPFDKRGSAPQLFEYIRVVGIIFTFVHSGRNRPIAIIREARGFQRFRRGHAKAGRPLLIANLASTGPESARQCSWTLRDRTSQTFANPKSNPVLPF